MNEIWKDIKNFENKYQVSNLGNIRSLNYNRQNICKNVSLTIVGAGYLSFNFCKGGKKIRLSAHRLVAQAFIPNPYNKPDINHKNGIKTDNYIENLEWVTKKENQKHSHVMGLAASQKGENNPFSKLTEKDIYKIRELFDNGVSGSKIGKMFGITSLYAGRIKNRKVWRHLCG